MLYESDAYDYKERPVAVVFPESTEQVAFVLRIANEFGVPFVARGAGTGLSGGAIPPPGGIVITLTRMNHIIEVDIENRCAVVEPGVVNLVLNRAVAPYGYIFAPDPSSQKVSTIGGNTAENAGGPHCLKYGVTADHILRMQVVLPDGDTVEVSGKNPGVPGCDLAGLLCGSEGMLGIITRLTVRLIPAPDGVRTMLAIFRTIEAAAATVSAIIAAGITPATVEMMDNLAIQAIEPVVKAGYPMDAAAVLLIEVDGRGESLERQAKQIVRICFAKRAASVETARSEAERDRLWTGRRGMGSAITAISPNYANFDGVVPRNQIVEALRRISQIGQKYGIRILNSFHAGDGNLHPTLLFDATKSEQVERVHRAGLEILKICVELGGSITGEHGVGIEKKDAMSFMFRDTELAFMRKVKDVFDPKALCNVGKMFPGDAGGGEVQPISGEFHASRSGEWPLNAPARETAAHVVDNLTPKYVVHAACPQDVADVITEASRSGEGLIPWGGGTKVHVGNIPSTYDAALCLDRLDRVLEYDVENQTLTVEAGARFADVLEIAAGQGQRLPITLTTDMAATVGGVVATNDYGPEAGHHGYLRNFILGLEVVLPTGEILSLGGKVVKNVAGLNVSRLFIGSYGTFGVITKATFRLVPRPEKTLILGFWLDGFQNVANFMATLAATRVDPSSVELFDSNVPGKITSMRPLKVHDPVLVVVRLEGFEEEVSWQQKEIERSFRTLIPTGGGYPEVVDLADLSAQQMDPQQMVSKMRAHFFAADGPEDMALLKIVTPSTRSGFMVSASRRLAQNYGLAAAVIVYALDGTIFLRLSRAPGQYNSNTGQRAFAKSVASFIRDLRAVSPGPIVALRVPLDIKSDIDVWGDYPGKRLVHRLKAAIDPKGILAPGRM